MPEHPDITRALHTGYPQIDTVYPHCPVCGSECETLYKNKYGEVFACDECVKIQDAWDIQEFEEFF